MELSGGELATLVSRGHDYGDITRAIVMLSVMDIDRCIKQTEMTKENKLKAVFLEIQTIKQ